MKRVPLIASLLVLAAAPAIAFAQDAGEVDIEQSVTISSAYVFEDQALVIDGSPVINYSASATFRHVEASIWVQAGNRNAQELDGGLRCSDVNLGPVAINCELSAYTYPTTGYDTIYTGAVGASVPLPLGVSGNVTIQRYLGGQDSTKVSLALSRDFGRVSVAVGYAMNDPEGTRPTFVRISAPLGRGDRAPTISFRGFVDGSEHGAVVDLSRSF